MNSIQQFVELAIKGDKNHWGTIGYGDTIGSDGSVSIPRSISYILLDPRAWQAVGKARGWDADEGNLWGGKRWLGFWHDFIDSLAEGKDIYSALEEILK